MPAPIPTTYFVPDETTSPKFARAFAQGCKGPMTSELSLRPGGFAAFCTPAVWPLLKHAQREGREWFYGDHAFFRRGKFYRVAMNRYQYQPTTHDLRHARPHRLRELCGRTPETEWRTEGSSIVICPQSEVYMKQFGIDAHQWTMGIVEYLSRYTDRPIVIRWKSQAQRHPIEIDLHNAWALVTFASAAAVDALLVGVPIFVLAPWASCASMGLSDLSKIETPARPAHRLPFLWTLAENQWTLSEIAAGAAWKKLHA